MYPYIRGKSGRNLLPSTPSKSLHRVSTLGKDVVRGERNPMGIPMFPRGWEGDTISKVSIQTEMRRVARLGRKTSMDTEARRTKKMRMFGKISLRRWKLNAGKEGTREHLGSSLRGGRGGAGTNTGWSLEGSAAGAMVLRKNGRKVGDTLGSYSNATEKKEWGFN